MDLRIKKTQRALVSAMFHLLESQKFGKITVNDLCTEAMISRTAFYSHFEDKYALLKFCIQMMKQRLFEEIEDKTLHNLIKKVLENTIENVKPIKNLLLAGQDVELVEMMRKSFQDDLERHLNDHKIQKETLPGPIDVIALYYASGITSVIMYWINKNLPYTVDEMTACLLALIPQHLL